MKNFVISKLLIKLMNINFIQSEKKSSNYLNLSNYNVDYPADAILSSSSVHWGCSLLNLNLFMCVMNFISSIMIDRRKGLMLCLFFFSFY